MKTQYIKPLLCSFLAVTPFVIVGCGGAGSSGPAGSAQESTFVTAGNSVSLPLGNNFKFASNTSKEVVGNVNGQRVYNLASIQAIGGYSASYYGTRLANGTTSAVTSVVTKNPQTGQLVQTDFASGKPTRVTVLATGESMTFTYKGTTQFTLRFYNSSNTLVHTVTILKDRQTYKPVPLATTQGSVSTAAVKAAALESTSLESESEEPRSKNELNLSSLQSNGLQTQSLTCLAMKVPALKKAIGVVNTKTASIRAAGPYAKQFVQDIGFGALTGSGVYAVLGLTVSTPAAVAIAPWVGLVAGGMAVASTIADIAQAKITNQQNVVGEIGDGCEVGPDPDEEPTATPTSTPTSTPTEAPTATPTNTPEPPPTATPEPSPTPTPIRWQGDYLYSSEDFLAILSLHENEDGIPKFVTVALGYAGGSNYVGESHGSISSNGAFTFTYSDDGFDERIFSGSGTLAPQPDGSFKGSLTVAGRTYTR